MKKIGFIGASGVGKTTIASGLFHYIKTHGKKVEYVPELIKYKVFSGEDFSRDGFDIQNTLEQQNLENNFNNANLDYLICEAPLVTGYIYSSFYGKELEIPVLRKIALDNINNYDVLIWVKHTESMFDETGRKENIEQSLELEKTIPILMNELKYTKSVLQVTKFKNIEELFEMLV
jgi:nicotinamide riboside kinase